MGNHGRSERWTEMWRNARETPGLLIEKEEMAHEGLAQGNGLKLLYAPLLNSHYVIQVASMQCF